MFDISRVRINWEGAWAVDYKVQLGDASAGPWTDLKVVTGNNTGKIKVTRTDADR